MAIIIDRHTGIKVIIQPQHVFGRHTTSATILSNIEASRVHAVIIWDGEAWLLQDTSSNGTFVNDKRLAREYKLKLQLEDHIQFGHDQVGSWYVEDLSPPESLLIPITLGLPTIHLTDITVLPSEEAPEISIYRSPQGNWLCEGDNGIYELKMGDLLGSHDKQWKFVDANPCSETKIISDKITNQTEEVSFKFDVSQNEEHVALQIKLQQQHINLGIRNHHYLLLLLARKYLSDHKKGLSKKECGWIDKDLLSSMLGQNENHINIQIYRFRKQLLKACPSAKQGPQFVERRTGEIRFSSEKIQIIGGIDMATTSNYDENNLTNAI